MKFPYKQFFVQSPGSSIQTVSRPVIPIHLNHNQYRIAYEALVDSGADYSIFHAEIGEAIGVNVKNGKRVHFAGVSGVSQLGFRHPIKLELGKKKFGCSVVCNAYGVSNKADNIYFISEFPFIGATFKFFHPIECQEMALLYSIVK